MSYFWRAEAKSHWMKKGCNHAANGGYMFLVLSSSCFFKEIKGMEKKFLNRKSQAKTLNRTWKQSKSHSMEKTESAEKQIVTEQQGPA